MPIYKAGQPAPQLGWKILVIYGDYASRKSSIATTAKNSLLIDFDEGSKRVHDILNKNKLVIKHGWTEVEALARNGDFDEFDTIIIDTAKVALDRFLMEAVLEDIPGLKDTNGVPKQDAYAVMYNRFQDNLLSRIRNKVIIFVAHGDYDSDNKKQMPVVSGKTGQFILGLADQVGFVQKVGDKVFINFTTSGAYVSKDQAGVGILEVPHFSEKSWPTFLQTQVIDKIGWHDVVETPKKSIEEQGEELKVWTNKISAITDASGMNEVVKDLKEVSMTFSKPIDILLRSLVKEKVKALELKLKGKVYENPVQPVITITQTPSEPTGPILQMSVTHSHNL